jgi:hypothetical protein
MFDGPCLLMELVRMRERVQAGVSASHEHSDGKKIGEKSYHGDHLMKCVLAQGGTAVRINRCLECNQTAGKSFREMIAKERTSGTR